MQKVLQKTYQRSGSELTFTPKSLLLPKSISYGLFDAKQKARKAALKKAPMDQHLTAGMREVLVMPPPTTPLTKY